MFCGQCILRSDHTGKHACSQPDLGPKPPDSFFSPGKIKIEIAVFEI